MSGDLKPLVGVIGGSGLYKLDNLEVVKSINVTTPWGAPSSPVTIATLPSGTPIAFLARHGLGHTITPSEVNGRANIAALKSVGVRAIVAFSAVGSLREEIKPGDFILPTQIIDRTRSLRVSTFFPPGEGIVAHASFGDPFSVPLLKLLEPLVRDALKNHGVDLHAAASADEDKTVVCMEGPQFSTRAESKMYRSWGGDIINMSVLPEAKLAREAELSYALICTATDYDAWRVGAEPVTVAEVIKTLTTNASNSKAVASAILQRVNDALVSGDLKGEEGAMEYAIVTAKEKWTEEAKERLGYLLPYFK